MRYSLSPGWMVDFAKDEIFVKNEIRGISLKKIKNVEAIHTYLLQNSFLPSEIGQELTDYLLNEKIIREDIHLGSNIENSKYKKQIDFWSHFRTNANSIHEVLGEKKIMIVGLGGIGSIVLEILAGAGIKNFTLVDSDKVEPSNLNRQFLYLDCDIGRYKTDSSSDNISKRHSDLIITKRIMNYPSSDFKDLINESDFVVSAIDQPSLKSAIKLCQESWLLNKSSAFAACGIYKAVTSPIFDKNKSKSSPIDSCKFNKNNEYLITPPVSASSGGWNSMIASILSEQILLYLAGVDEEVSYHDYTYTLRDHGKIKTIHQNTITL